MQIENNIANISRTTTVNFHKITLALLCAILPVCVMAQNNIAEEVAWMIGDTPLYKSEIEQTYQDYQSERLPINGDPYCVIPEQMAVQRLFLHQADIDTIEVQPSQVSSRVEAQINYLISMYGSKEKVEQYSRKTINELRDYYTTSMTDQYRAQSVQENLTKDLKVTPADVNKYFRSLPKDSIPYVPQQVEVKIITLNPVIPQQEIDNVKARLREYAERVNNGEVPFSTLAILYSTDQSSAPQGGELGFLGRGQLVPEFAAVAFNLNDPKKVSKIVESEYGYHIIQLIEKRGDRVNCRHILLQPEVAEKDLIDATIRLDSLRTLILKGEEGATFEEAARHISQDKDTRNSNGLMVNPKTGTTRFQMSELPQEIAKAVANLEPGEISEAFIMRSAKNNREQVSIVKLVSRIDAHQATYADDYQLIKNMYENSQREKIINDWLAKKIKDTYVRVEEGWRGCDFEHEGWIR